MKRKSKFKSPPKNTVRNPKSRGPYRVNASRKSLPVLQGEDGKRTPISVLGALLRKRTRELEELKIKFQRERKLRKTLEKELLRDEGQLIALLRLASMVRSTQQEIADFVLESAANLTDSPMSYILPLENNPQLKFRSWFEQELHNCGLNPSREHDAKTSRILTECLRTRSPVIHNDFPNLPNRIELPSGHAEIFSHMNIPVFDQDKIVAIVGVGNKVTAYDSMDANHLALLAQGMWSVLQRKRAGEEMRRAQLQAEDASNAKSEFLAHMSHEIRTPLNGVLGLTELLADTPLSTKQREYVQLIRSSGKSLQSLISDILDFSKIESGSMELKIEEFDLYVLVESVLGILGVKAAEKGLELGVFFDPTVPRMVHGDMLRLRQVFFNLVSNGVKFTESGGVRLRVTSKETMNEEVELLCEILDTGSGIATEKIDRLFKSFSQVDSGYSRKFDGSGLGLIIAERLLRLMDGTIGVDSTLGEGSRFWFTVTLGLPKRKLVASQVSVYRKKTEFLGDLRQAFRTVRTLIVDDNEILRSSLSDQLGSWGMEVNTAGTQAKAFERLEEASEQDRPYNLLIVDTTIACEDHKGVEDGLKFIEEVKKSPHWSDVSIIFLIPLNSSLDIRKIRKIGVSIHLGKPVYTSSLFDAVVVALYPDLLESSNTKKSQENSGIQTSDVAEEVSGGSEEVEKIIRILVAEDNRINQIVVRDILNQAGFQCQIVENGRLALDTVVAGGTFDAVLMDCQMPVMDGFEATHAIREFEEKNRQDSPKSGRHLPIIALTANATKGDEEKCISAGMDAYCSKPIDPKKLISTIESFLN